MSENWAQNIDSGPMNLKACKWMQSRITSWNFEFGHVDKCSKLAREPAATAPQDRHWHSMRFDSAMNATTFRILTGLSWLSNLFTCCGLLWRWRSWIKIEWGYESILENPITTFNIPSPTKTYGGRNCTYQQFPCTVIVDQQWSSHHDTISQNIRCKQVNRNHPCQSSVQCNQATHAASTEAKDTASWRILGWEQMQLTGTMMWNDANTKPAIVYV